MLLLWVQWVLSVQVLLLWVSIFWFMLLLVLLLQMLLLGLHILMLRVLLLSVRHVLDRALNENLSLKTASLFPGNVKHF